MFRFEGKVVFVMGVGFGFGVEIVCCFVVEGVLVVFLDVYDENGQCVMEEICVVGGVVVYVYVDVFKVVDNEVMVVVVKFEFGWFDVFVNNVGYCYVVKFFWEFFEEEYDGVFDMNIKGIYFGCKVVLLMMIEQGFGVIVNIVLIGVVVLWLGIMVYNVMKGVVMMMMCGFVLEVVFLGICVNVVNFVVFEIGFVKGFFGVDLFSDEQCQQVVVMILMGCFVEFLDVVEVVFFFVLDVVGFFMGVCLLVDGGCSIG